MQTTISIKNNASKTPLNMGSFFFLPVRLKKNKKKKKKKRCLRSLKKTAARSLCGRPSHAEYQQLSSGSGGSARIRNRYVCGAQVKQI
jgi:hypothetical protein